MCKSILALITAALLMTPLISGGQPSVFPVHAPLSQSALTQWTGDNGLVSNNITSAIRDRNGFVWITSYNGIMQFDGIQVYVYDKAKIPFLSTGAFYGVYEDKDSTLWFASQSSGLIKYSNEQFVRIDADKKILPNSIRCLFIAADGTLWIGSNNSGLFKMKDNVIEKVEHPALNDRSILDLVVDRRNNVWIATEGNGLYRYDGKVFEPIKGVSSPTISSICISTRDEVLIGTPNGLDVYRDGKVTPYVKLSNYQVNKIIHDKDEHFWVGTEIGLARFTLGDDSSFEYISEKAGFPLSRISSLYFDNENSLWVSTGKDGLVQLRESGIVNITSKQGLSQNKINIIYEGAGKHFYIGSDAGSLDVYHEGEIKSVPLLTPLNDVGVRDLYIDKQGALWIVSYRGIIKKTAQGEKLYGAKDGFPVAEMRRVLADDDGALWFGSRSGGVVRFKDEKVERIYDKGHGLESNYVLALEKDRHGNIYVGTHSGGMNIIRKDGTVETFHVIGNDAGLLIFNIHIDSNDKIWVVNSLGLFHFDGKTFQPVKLIDEPKGAVYFDWQEDTLGGVWITTNVGLLKVKKSDVEKVIRKEMPAVSFKLFDNRDGMKSKECTAATRTLRSSSGRIWVPTINGASVFYPEKIVDNKIPPPVFVTNLKADNKEIEGPQPKVIKEGRLRYTFFYTAPSFIVPGKIKFKYKLDGVDGDWIDAGTTREAEYTNLWPGEYTFHALACNNDGVWSTKEATLTFRVKPYFYQTAIFYIFLVGLAGIILYGLYKWRVNVIERRNAELRKLNDELDRFVYSASHDLRAPLASVLGLVNVARLDQGKNLDLYLQKIESSILKLDGFIGDIINFSRNARVDIEVAPIEFESLINELIDNLKYLDEKDQIKRVVKVTGVGAFVSDKKRISIVLNNLISNAIKYFNPYAGNSFIEISVTYDEHQAVIRVKDNGIGISEDHIANIFKMFYRGDTRSRGSGIGLYIVKETLDKIKGRIQVQSEYGKGSTFTIILGSLS